VTSGTGHDGKKTEHYHEGYTVKAGSLQESDAWD
jgi:hypothetical protein